MNYSFKFHKSFGIAELLATHQVIDNVENALEVIGNISYQGYTKLIVHKHHLSTDFFELKNGLAGEILQKFSTYQIRMAIVGDFSNLLSKSLRDFIYESNKQKNILFLSSKEEAISNLY